ncbi:MAG: AAA family ATPase [Bryobacterales bacterium]|nr:AAA family ATPase [Bryobacterales bacterium]
MRRRQLPTGIQDFPTIRGDDFYYVDKTPLIHRLVSTGRYYFLSRPRRFGKSLLVDTLRQLFTGNEPLFRGLHIHDHWDWSVEHPVVRLGLGGNYRDPGSLENDVRTQLFIIEGHTGLNTVPNDLPGPYRLPILLDHLHRSTGERVVVLVDEYDKPILDVLDNPRRAKANREYLCGLYGIVKDCAEHVRFVFVTGVSMFSKVSLFSGLNNLKDISLDPRYATLCGYTDNDLDTVFAPELPGLDRKRVRDSYDGYRWLGEESVYNPFDILLLFDSHRFEPHWFTTGPPDFLYRTMLEQGVSALDLENRIADKNLLSTFDVGNFSIDALLFQTGYLTIVSEDSGDAETFFTLDYPNGEVRGSLNRGLLAYLGQPVKATHELGRAMCQQLVSNDFEAFASSLQSLIGGIPYQWQVRPEFGRYEA